MKHMKKEAFIQKLNINERQQEQFEIYQQLLCSWNQKMNLTAITDEEEIWEKHFYDSVMPFVDLPAGTLCDVGSGAGFPGIPAAIVYPQLQVTLLEPNHKRCRFLEEVKTQCSVPVEIVCARAEDFVKERRESFDYVSARAVARMTLLMELCAPLLKVDGLMIALKGRNGNIELDQASQAMKILGMKLEQEKAVTIEDAEHLNFYFRKVRSTPKKYPRNYGQMKKKPLGE